MAAEAELYLESVWASLPEELKKRVLAAVNKSVSETPDPNKKREIFIASPSREHLEAVDWLIDQQGRVKGGTIFTLSSTAGNKTQNGLKLHSEMTDYIIRRVIKTEKK